ncbi:MAG TPA: hypothetical protein VK530_08705 [Candidatus Acidoferrum sp.]|nr:hypothetical protein [Candidatus Acidoferrum sp.]
MRTRFLNGWARSAASRFSLITAAILTSTVLVPAAGFVTDFNSGLPAGTKLVASGVAPSIAPTNGVGNSGVLKLTSHISGGSANAFYVTNLVSGSLTNFRARFRLALGGGDCCGLRQADGIAFAIGNDLPLNGGFGQEGAGTGLIVAFDTWDNANADTAPAIDLKLGGTGEPGNVVAFQSMSSYGLQIRDAGRADAGPVLTNSAGQEVPLFTMAPAPAVPNDTSFVEVYIELFPDNTFSLSYSNVVVWNHLPIAYTPISGSISFGIGGATGGASENAWIDDLLIFANFADGPAVFTVQPVNQTVTESQPATFSIAVNGTPPYLLQWYSNSVPIVGANGLSYTIPVTTTNLSGTIFTASVTNSLGGAVSGNAVLTVNPGIIVQGVTTDGFTDRVRVTFTKPAARVGLYSLNNSATVGTVTQGSNPNDVILTTSPLAAGVSYTLTIAGEEGIDGSDLTPAPTLISFTQVGAFCTDFASGLPANSALFGVARRADDGTGTNTVIHLTDDSQNTGVYGHLYVSNLFGNSTLHALQASWRTRLGGPAFGNADGMSFNWGSDIPADGTFQAAEDGVGSYLSFNIDTWDQGTGSPVTGGPDTGIEIEWRGSRIAFLHIPRTPENGDTNFVLAHDYFVDTKVSVNATGFVSFTYDTNTITGVIPNWTGVRGGAINIAARTGGEADNHWIDDLCISNFNLGSLAFVVQPVDTTALEGVAATFSVGVDGSPTYFYQWFTNGVPVAGATNGTYTTALTTGAMEGQQVSVNVSNLFSSVTSSNASLHVLTNPRIVNVRPVGDNEVHILWTRPVDINEGFYQLDNGVFVNLVTHGSNHNEVVILTDPLVSGVTYTLTAENIAEEGNLSNVQLPNPDSRSFRPGYGSFCADFAVMPPGTTVGGQAVVSGGFLHLTDANAPGGVGWFFIPDPNAGFPVDRLLVSYRSLVGRPDANRPADGYSFNIGSDITAATQPAEDGYGGQGLTISFDQWDNAGADTAPAVEILYKGVTVASRSLAGVRDAGRPPTAPFQIDNNGNPLALDTSNAFVNVRLSVGPDGKMDFYFKDYLIFQGIQLPNYTGFQNANISIAGRVGGASENHWIDDLCVNAFTIGAPVITAGPTNVTIIDTNRAKLQITVDGLPPYVVQWYSNNVAITGATALVYDTPSLSSNLSSVAYYAVVSNSFGSITSSVATVTIVPRPATPVPLYIVRNTDGSTTLTWTGTGWTLQATDTLNTNPGLTIWQDTPYTSPLVIPPGYFGTGQTNVFFRLKQ